MDGDASHPHGPAIAAVIEASIGWAVDKDLPRLYRSLVQDERLFLFHPDEDSTIVGFQAFQSMAERVFLDPAFQATGHAIRDLRIQVDATSTVAWFSARLDDHGTWNGAPCGWENARWTGVLLRELDEWRIVQMHFSLPTPPA
jgi:hypothetical protein